MDSSPWERDALGSRLRAAAGIALVCALALLGARFAGYEAVLQLVAASLSADGVVTPAGRLQLARLLVSAALLAAVLGVLLLVLANRRWRATLDAVMRWDPLRAYGLATPNAYLVLACSACLGVLLVTVWELRARLGSTAHFLLAKEGPFEDATFVLEFAAAWLCALAALRLKRRAQVMPRAVPMLYAVCALALFVIAMEEINWGQTVVAFETPSAWAAINYQQETSVHNLLDRETLNVASQILAVAFGVVVLLMLASSALAPRSTIAAIAPQASLTPLALMTVYSGVYLHPEATELLLAVFFLFYSVRIYVAARSTAQSPKAAEPDVPLARGATPSSWDTELLEYTHDAIIMWEMKGNGILYWNRAAEQLYGFTRKEAHGRITHELLRTRLAGGVNHLESMVARYGIWVGELQHTTRDGRQVQVEARLALMSQHSGRWLVLEVNRDVTDKNAAEANQAAIEQQLAEMRGLLDQFSRTTEVRSPACSSSPAARP
jgi:PAS domain S-box-containing protein